MQTIYLDISNKGVIPCVQAKQSEVGRKFLAVITDNGIPYNIPSDSLLSVWYEGDTDAGNYSSIEENSAFSIDGNKVAVELVAQMLLKPGKGELCLSVTHGDGGETNTWNIPYEVEYKPGAGSTVPTEYYTAFQETASKTAKNADYVAREAERINALMIESGDYPGCYYRMVGNVKEWLNPPLSPGVEYRTTARFNGEAEYVKLVQVLPLSIPETGDYLIPHNISGLYRVTKVFATYGFYKLLPWFDHNSDNFSLITRVDTSHIYFRNKKATWASDSGIIEIVVYYTKGG